MTERKLVKQGRNALTITLPAKWLKKNNLTGKDSVNITEQRGDLIISSRKGKEQRTIELDIKNLKESFAFHLVLGKYIEGYDTIILGHNNPSLAYKIGEAYLGMIIEEHQETRTVIKNIIRIPENNFMQIFKRAAQSLVQQARTLQKIIEKTSTPEDIKIQERFLDKNIFYCMRYINKYECVKDSYKYFLLCTTIEEAGDIISKISVSITPKNKKQVETIIELIENYVTYLLTSNIEKMYDSLKHFKVTHRKETYLDGISIILAETLYNYIGFVIEKNN